MNSTYARMWQGSQVHKYRISNLIDRPEISRNFGQIPANSGKRLKRKSRKESRMLLRKMQRMHGAKQCKTMQKTKVLVDVKKQQQQHWRVYKYFLYM